MVQRSLVGASCKFKVFPFSSARSSPRTICTCPSCRPPPPSISIRTMSPWLFFPQPVVTGRDDVTIERAPGGTTTTRPLKTDLARPPARFLPSGALEFGSRRHLSTAIAAAMAGGSRSRPSRPSGPSRQGREGGRCTACSWAWGTQAVGGCTEDGDAVVPDSVGCGE